MKKKCPKCKNIKSLEDFYKDKTKKDGHGHWCKNCGKETNNKYRNTEIGFLRIRFISILERCRLGNRKCYFTFDEFRAAWEKHKSIYGMRSAWGPGIDHLEQHLPITMIFLGKGQEGTSGVIKGAARTVSNLSVDRLDTNRDYTLQNLIFIRGDENERKKHTTYEDCKIQIKIHEERFINMKAI